MTTGEATQKRHEVNREFFDAMSTATTQNAEPAKGAHQLKLGNDLTSTVINDQLIISRDDGNGNQDVVYGHSRETEHLSGTGDGHIDKLSSQEKAGALKHVHSLGVPKDLSNYKSSKSQSRSSRSRQNKSRDSGFDR